MTTGYFYVSDDLWTVPIHTWAIMYQQRRNDSKSPDGRTLVLCCMDRFWCQMPKVALPHAGIHWYVRKSALKAGSVASMCANR